MKFAAYVPELVMSEIEQLYFFNTNLAFRQYASKLATAIRIFSHIKVQCNFVSSGKNQCSVLISAPSSFPSFFTLLSRFLFPFLTLPLSLPLPSLTSSPLSLFLFPCLSLPSLPSLSLPSLPSLSPSFLHLASLPSLSPPPFLPFH